MKKMVLAAILLAFLPAASMNYGPAPTSQVRQAAAEWTLAIDRAKAAIHGLTRDDILRSIAAATNSTASVNSYMRFWIDDQGGAHYLIGVQYPDERSKLNHDILNIPLIGRGRAVPVPLRDIANLRDAAWHRLLARPVNLAWLSCGAN